jgi:hypothetical protein
LRHFRRFAVHLAECTSAPNCPCRAINRANRYCWNNRVKAV